MLKYLKILFFVCLVQFTTVFSQEIKGVRYEFTPNMLLELAEQNPDKRDEIVDKTNKLPQFTDIYLYGGDVIQTFYGENKKLIGVLIFSTISKEVISISKLNKLEKKEFLLSTDSTFLKKKFYLNESIVFYTINDKGIIPVRFVLSDTLKPKDDFLINWSRNYVELSFIQKNKIFPEKMIFGQPKTLKTYTYIKELEFDETELIKAIEAFSDNKNSKMKRKILLDNFVEIGLN